MVDGLNDAAWKCIPKYDPSKTKNRHNIPLWRERMGSYKHDVDYWQQMQFLHGGKHRCPVPIKDQLRMAKSRYRHQFRLLRREIECIIADSTTAKNCSKQLFRQPKAASPALIEGCSKSAQPAMWREHFMGVFKGNDSPFENDMLKDTVSEHDLSKFDPTLDELNLAIDDINTNKSYTRHKHCKFLQLAD